MKRIQLFEFEDFHWFPKPIRRSMTNLIAVLNKMVVAKELITGFLSEMISESKIHSLQITNGKRDIQQKK